MAADASIANAVDTTEALHRQLAFLERFASKRWCPPVVDVDVRGLRYWTRVPPQLTAFLQTKPSPQALEQVASNIGLALLDLHTAGVIHGNLGPEAISVDPETLQPLLGQPIAIQQLERDIRFANNPDLVGGPQPPYRFSTPPISSGPCYQEQLASLLGVSVTRLVELVQERLIGQLTELGGEDRTPRNDIPYGDILLPGFHQQKGRRDPKGRLAAFGISFEDQSVFDVGAHTGSLLFESMNRGANLAVGLEYDQARAQWVNRVASFNGVADRVWCWWGDVRKCAFPAAWNEHFSILSFQALFGRLLDDGPSSLRRCLGLLKAGGTLLFETNHVGHESSELWATRLSDACQGLIDPPEFVGQEWKRFAFRAKKRAAPLY